MSEEEANHLVNLLVENQFIDELRYATAYAHDQSRFNKWGCQKIREALQQKGVSQEHIEAGLAALHPKEYREMVFEELSKKAKNLCPVGETWGESQTKKLYHFALRRGFEEDLISDFLREK